MWVQVKLSVATVVLQLLMQYRLNLWNRDFFNALEFRNGAETVRLAEHACELTARRFAAAAAAMKPANSGCGRVGRDCSSGWN